ncbi:MAG TPA: polysaccharide biosynthesis C-terminal domain-containing protein [Solirubrobacteraceae bacterium]|jgi:O-antigen/teichoic acid export membrane protein|nr:polysaccharide biosynthesis C-terminal domain-containing protein [Solirubrobacteraceae bacterium]
MAFSLANFALIGAITLFTSVLSARLYGIAIVGQAALVLAPITIVTLLSTVREQPSMVRELAKLQPRHPRATGITLAVFLFSFILTTVVTGLGIVGCYFAFHGPLHNPGLLAPATVGLCGYLVIINTCWNIDGVFGAFRAGRELFAVRLNQAVLYGVLLVVFIFITHSVWGLLWAFLGSWLTSLVHRLLLLRRVIRLRVPLADIRAGFSSLRVIVAFGLKMTPGFLAIGFSEASGTWIIGATSSVSAVGAFSRAWNFATRLTELNWRITEMLLPTLVQHRHTGDTEGFDRVLVDSFRYAAFGMLLPAAVGGGAAQAIMHIFGSGFETAATALRLLLFVPLLQTLTAIQGAALVAHDRPFLTSVGQIVRLVVTVGGGVALTLAYGITGMAIAMAAGALMSFCVLLVLLKSRAGTSMPALLRLRQIMGFGVAYGSGYVVSHLLEQHVHGGLGLVVALVAGSAAYIAVGIGVSGTTHHDRARLKVAIRQLSRGRVAAREMSGTA